MLLVASGCAKKKKMSVPKPPKIGRTETGIASWYGNPYHGRRSASGEIYDMEKLTAAHRTFPFDTWVRVQCLENRKTVDVRIIDRGPFVGGRIIDLSRAAARQIDMLGPGTARVRIQVIREQPKSPAAEGFGVQIGAFRDKSRADKLRGEMARKFGAALVVYRDGAPPLWRVIVGNEATEEAAETLAEKLRSRERAAFVVRLDGVGR